MGDTRKIFITVELVCALRDIPRSVEQEIHEALLDSCIYAELKGFDRASCEPGVWGEGGSGDAQSRLDSVRGNLSEKACRWVREIRVMACLLRADFDAKWTNEQPIEPWNTEADTLRVAEDKQVSS